MRLTHVALFAGNPKAGGDAAAFSGGSAREGAYPENELDAPVSVVQLPAGEILVADAGSHTIKVAVVEKVKKPWTDGWSTAASKPMCGLTLVGRGGKPGCVDGKGKVPGMPRRRSSTRRRRCTSRAPDACSSCRARAPTARPPWGSTSSLRQPELRPRGVRGGAAAKAPLKASVKTVVGGRPRALDAVAALLDVDGAPSCLAARTPLRAHAPRSPPRLS